MARRAILVSGLVAALLIPVTGFSYPRDDAAVVEVEVRSRDDIHRLNELGMDIMSVRDGVAEIAAVPEEIESLWANGFRPNIVLENMRSAVKSLDLPGRGEYHSYAELTADLAAWATAYPTITEVVSIGQSHEGREIWAIKITDSPDIEEPEPEIQWIGCHHGDETISVEVPYYMAEYLLENYGSDQQVTWLVDNREIWIIPMLNPDGHTAGSRYNALGIDLNRNYLCPCGCNPGTAFSGVESSALRNFNVGMNPVTSLTFHSGAVYVNYLWDYTYDPTPDEPMIITLSNGYASYCGYPVTNGADWYIVHGSCQDWCYETRGEIDWTIELSNTKDPPAPQIDPIFAENLGAMLYLARHSGHGIRGTVTDSETGEPLAATISIPEIGKDVHTDPDVGDYHRMVESGTYTVVASVDGYAPVTAYNITANLDTFVVVDFEMEPPPAGTIAGYVYDDGVNPLGAYVEVTDIGGHSTTADSSTGYYVLENVPAGSRDLSVSKDGYMTATREGVLVSQGGISTESFTLASPAFYDDLESGLSAWTGSWALTSAASHSPTSSATDSPSGDYANNAYSVLALSEPIDLSAAESGVLAFWHRYATEPTYDYCYVHVSSDGGSNWAQVASFDGTQLSWTEVEIDIGDYVGTDAFSVRFVLDSDGWVTADGWYVDDVRVFGDAPSVDVPGGSVAPDRLVVANYPNPFNPRTRIRYDVPATGTVELSVYDVSGRLVRTLVAGEKREAGTHHESWDGTDDRGDRVAAGVYFARVRNARHTASTKMVLLK